MLTYTIVLEWDPEWEGWAVHVPALPGCFTQGKTKEEAVTNAREAIEAYIGTLKDLGRDVPTEDEPPVTIERVEIKAA